MNKTVNFLYTIYFKLPNFSPKFEILNKSIDRFYGFIFKRLIQFYFNPNQNLNKLNSNNDGNELIVISMTSFPERLNEIHFTLISIFSQTVKPNAVVLYLYEKQFPNKETPENLKKFVELGLKIKFVSEDLRSHTKYYYAFQDYPNSLIITMDDDTYYPTKTIEQLVLLHNKYTNDIIANRVHKITFNGALLKPYRDWYHNYKSDVSSFLYLATGVSGILYPINSLDTLKFDLKVLKEKCYYADDIWLKIMSMQNNRKVRVTQEFTRDLLTVGSSQKTKLVTINSHGGGNDKQLHELTKHFGLGNLEKYKDS